MKAKLILSTTLGVFFGVATYIILLRLNMGAESLLLAILSGLGFGIMLLIGLLVTDKRMEKRYRELEKDIVSPVFYKTNGNFNLGHTVRNGNIYFCDDGILFALLDTKPPILEELPVYRIKSYQFDGLRLFIHTVDGEKYVITTQNVDEVRTALKNKQWI